MNFSDRLALLRRTRGFTQKQLADIFETTERNIRFYEGGDRRPGLDGLIAMADFFEISLDYLVGRTDDPQLHQLDE